MTKFLADENIPPAVIDFLRAKGFDVKTVQELGKSGSTTGEESPTEWKISFANANRF